MSTYSINDSIGFHINQTANLLRNRFNALLKPYGLTSEQYVILKAIGENPKITPSQLADILQKDKTTLTRMIATMVKNGLLLRDKLPDDRRSHLLAWTDQAASVMETVIPETDAVIKKMRQLFTKDELQCFFKILDELRSIENLKDL